LIGQIGFSDEKKFNLDGPDGYEYYWNFREGIQNILQRFKFMCLCNGLGSNFIPLREVPKKYDSTKYCALLEEGLIPYYDDGDIFQQDGASCHTSKETMKFLKQNEIETVKCPAKSPDPNQLKMYGDGW
jgi:hypothetical protein